MKESTVRADLQVLRAVAVMAVVLYHLWPGIFPLGFLGVDIFFALSGYLITKILLREMAGPQKLGAKLSSFWARRARRLIPASLLTVLVTGLVAFFVTPAGWFEQAIWGGVASAGYFQNWFLAAQSVDYLAGEALVTGSVSPYQQFWSLSVEEQFYLFWPFVILSALIIGRRWRAGIVAVIGLTTLISFGWWWWGLVYTPEFAFFDTFARVWQFGIGALLALWVPGSQGLRLFQHRAWRPLTFIGDISYSLYLWHWPVIILAPWVLIRFGSTAITPLGFEWLLLAISILIATASKFWVEDPLRFGRLASMTPLKQIGSTLLATAVVIGSLVALSFTASQASANAAANTELQPSLSALAKDATKIDAVKYRVGKGEDGFKVAEFGDRASAVRIALVGDSHARQYFAALEELANNQGWALDVVSKSACSVQDPATYSLTVNDPSFRYCKEWNQRLAQHVAQNRYSLIINSNSTLVHDNNPAVAESFRLAIADWLDQGQQVLVLKDNPKPPNRVNAADFRVCLEFADGDFEKCAIPIDVATAWGDALASAAETISHPNLRVFDSTSWFCDESLCPVVIDSVIVYRDTSHISDTFAKTLGDEFKHLLLDALRPNSAEE